MVQKLSAESSRGQGPASLDQVIRKDPLFFEAIPPSKRASPAHLEDTLAQLEETLSSLHNLSAVNIPEIVDENHLGMPLYRTHEPCSFADLLRKRANVEVVVNKVVVHLRSRGDFLNWARGSLKTHDVHNFVVVGGVSHVRQYPGPNVVEACGILSHLFRTMNLDEGLIGCVTIPSRKDEAERLLAKTLAGARFATTQILFGANGTKDFLLNYGELCERYDVKPATIFLSFAPLQDAHDIELARWLGAEVPENLETKILSAGGEGANLSIGLAADTCKEIKDFAQKRRLNVPIGVNVEQISHHNLQAAARMARRLS
jgi:5,10-methylenetetrahydrofolate reductase